MSTDQREQRRPTPSGRPDGPHGRAVPTVFVGPTGHGVDLGAAFGPGCQLRPPARRGDVADLIARRDRPGVIVLVDGTFHSFPAVGHAELRDALDAGWQVWGVASLGAIRACEMRRLGMRGFGTVYRRYVDDPEFTDDEVTLLHAAEHPFRPASEPLIHLRHLLLDLHLTGRLVGAEHDHILAALHDRWYGERTLALLQTLLLTRSRLDPGTINAALAEIPRHRVKTHDLLRFAATAPWRPGGRTD